MTLRNSITDQGREIRQCLLHEGYSDCDRLFLSICLLALRGVSTVETVWNGALASNSILETAKMNTDTIDTRIDIPDSLYLPIKRLIFELAKESYSLGDIYENLVARRKQQGIYYTPPEAIDFILSHTVMKADIISEPNIRILDPTCGCGHFLIRAYDVLQEKFRSFRDIMQQRYPEGDWSDDGIHRHIVQVNLWGADIDSQAADIAAASLLFKRPNVRLACNPNILVCDTLKYQFSDSSSAFHRMFWEQKYHYVIGNPPYLSFGLRGNGNLEQDYRAFLRQAFPSSAEYKLSYYVLFMEQGIERLIHGGHLGFIVPDSFLLGRYYSKIRQYILDNTAIEIIAHIEKPVFKQVSAGFSIICVFRKKYFQSYVDEQLAVYQVSDKAALPQATAVNYMKQDYFASLPHQRFRLFFNMAVQKLITKIDHSGIPLSHYASGHTGVRSLTKQKEIVSLDCQGANWRKGLISGRQVQRYGLSYEGHWLHIHPDLLYKGGWNPSIVNVRKILVRQTGYNLTACLDKEGYYHLNNIHSFVLTKANDRVTLDYLLLLFNSRLLSFYYHIVSMEFGRAMAQTDIETLEQLPIREQSDINNQAAQIVSALQDCMEGVSHGDEQAIRRFEALDDYANKLVYRIYDLTDAEITFVEQYEQELHRKKLKVQKQIEK